ncbi:hypothetical protein NQ314_006824 [Rhamnusium bicolor]|uniref:Uncharacterized protein n=1 Tax=Rhamnusium bicolor TaxID=1586634 RepID=A0AAV8YXY3_9CUCU|nr:hypothetical protein NQ314_006824 [Rhamnusium bicolor]
MFYVICVQRQSKIGLTDKEIGDIKDYATRAIQGDEGANKYITDMYKERLDSAYTTGYAEDLYDIMMNVRTYIGTQGLEYIPIWNHMLENPTENSTPYNDVISYSTLFGFQTVGMIKEALPEELSQPLTPKLIDGKRNKLAHLDVYFWRRDEESPTKIGGMKIVFENGDTYTIGTVSELVQEIDFDEALLIELEVYSDGAVDCLVFHFSDGRTITCGIEDSGNDFHLAFELEGHHIVSLYMDFEVVEFGDKISNVSVAYQLINDHLLYHQ